MARLPARVHIDAELYPWFSIAAIVWGLLDCFFGYRVFKLTIALLGAVAGALLGQAGAQAAGLGSGGELAALLIGALAGAGLAFLAYIAAVFVAGFGFGATLAILLLSHFHHMVALFAALVVGVIGGIAAVKLQRVIIILATALLGAFRAIFALMYFTSQLDWLYYCRQPQQIPAVIDTNAWVFPSVLVLAAVGAIAQFEIGGGKGKGSGGAGAKKKEKKDKPAKD